MKERGDVRERVLFRGEGSWKKKKKKEEVMFDLKSMYKTVVGLLMDVNSSINKVMCYMYIVDKH